MKKDSELPWAIRIARWGAVILFLLYGTVKVIKEAEGVFWWTSRFGLSRFFFSAPEVPPSGSSAS